MPPAPILIVVSSPATSSTTGEPVGFWAAELFHPWRAFERAGHPVTVASTGGGAVALDALSDPRHPSGYSAADTTSLSFLERPDVAALLAATPAVADVDLAAHAAIVVAGGQAPMFTFRDALPLQRAFLEFARTGRVHAALCHGTSLLLHLRTADDAPFVRGRRMTGFTSAEEDVVDAHAGRPVMPFRIEDEARALGADFRQAEPFAPFALADGLLVTGQQQNSGEATARLVLELLQTTAAGA